MQIDGARVLLTGAAGGLGQAIARELKRRGAVLVLSGRNEVGLRTLAGQLGGAEILVADLADDDDVERVAADARNVDVVVANAGVGTDPPVHDDSAELIDRSVAINLRAPMVTATAFVQSRLAAKAAGHVVLVGSIASVVASPGTRLYNATKFGLRGFGLSLREELRDSAVGVSIVEPFTARDYERDGIAVVPFEPRIRYLFRAMRPRFRKPSRLADAFLEAVKAHLRAKGWA